MITRRDIELLRRYAPDIMYSVYDLLIGYRIVDTNIDTEIFNT